MTCSTAACAARCSERVGGWDTAVSIYVVFGAEALRLEPAALRILYECYSARRIARRVRRGLALNTTMPPLAREKESI
eukprot:364241-Chlamydomonas_euryale.AAC.9